MHHLQRTSRVANVAQGLKKNVEWVSDWLLNGTAAPKCPGNYITDNIDNRGGLNQIGNIGVLAAPPKDVEHADSKAK
jgi:hypothetical protein